MVEHRLRPPCGWRVLRPYVTGHWQHDGSIGRWKIADNTNIAAIAEPTRAPERAPERIFERQTKRQEERPGPIVGTRRVMPMIDERTEDRLGDVVTPRGELIEHEMLFRNCRPVLVRRVFDVVHCAGRPRP